MNAIIQVQGLAKRSEGSEVCPLSTLKDHYEIVRDSDRKALGNRMSNQHRDKEFLKHIDGKRTD